MVDSGSEGSRSKLFKHFKPSSFCPWVWCSMLAEYDSHFRCAERLVLGEANITTAGGGDLDNVNNIAREMVYRCGFSKRLGPVALMDTEEVFIGKGRTRAVANIGTELAAIALTDIEEVCASAQCLLRNSTRVQW